MKGNIRQMIIAVVLPIAFVGMLVVGSGLIASYLEGLNYVARVYGAETVIDSGPSIKDFINKTLAAGGGYAATDMVPQVTLNFLDDSEMGFGEGPDFTVRGAVDPPTGLKDAVSKILVYYSDFGYYHDYSLEFMNYTIQGKFSWYGNYSTGRMMRATLQTNNGTVDLGTSSITNVTFNLAIDSTTMNEREVSHPVWGIVKNWSGQWFGGRWEMRSFELLKMTGQSGSASLLFEGSVWLDGNYTVTVDGVTKSGVTNLSRNVSFGRIDLTFENGRIVALDFRFDRVDIILCVRPQE